MSDTNSKMPNTAFSIVLLIFIAATVLATIFLVKSCRHDPVPVFNPTNLQDSANKREQIVNKKLDSAIAAITRITNNYDSLKDINGQLIVELDGRKKITENLSDQYKAYRTKYDTVNALHKCDTLAEEVTRLDLAVMEYEDSNAKLYDSLQSITGINSLILSKKDYLYTSLRQSFDSLSAQYIIQSSSLQKAEKPKRWGIGLQTGITYEAGIKVLPSIGISYNIIRF